MRSLVLTGMLGMAVSLAGCGKGGSDGPAEPEVDEVTAETTEAPVPAWPAGLSPFGGGYPEDGAPCSRLRESAVVANYLDHTAILVGCPGGADGDEALALIEDAGAVLVGEVEGVALLSIPNPVSDADNPPSDEEAATPEGQSDFSGSLTGRETAQLTFSATQGQTINVTLTGPASMFFNILPPGGGPADAIYVGSRAIDDADFWAGVAPQSGEYSVLLYMMGNDRDAGVTQDYMLEIVTE